MRLRHLIAGGALAALVSTTAVAAGGVPGARSAAPRVSAGHVSVAGQTLTGAFDVRNKGPRSSAKGFAVVVALNGNARILLGRYGFKAMKPRGRQKLHFTVQTPAALSGSTSLVYACVLVGKRYRADRVTNCRALGHPTFGSVTPTGPAPTTPTTTPEPTTTPTPTPPTTPNPTPPPADPCAPSAPPATSASSVPSNPVAYTPDQPAEMKTPTKSTGGTPCADYWVSVPQSYAADNQTPMRLLVWLHGCGGDASGDIYWVTPNTNRDYLAIAVSGESGSSQCWDTAAGDDTDVNKVLNAIADVRSHVNVDPRRIIVGGYSSGGDLAYRTIFYHANEFAGILAMNTDPYRDTGSTKDQSLAAAAWKFNVYHLAHDGDETYPYTTVQPDIQSLVDAGYPVTFEHVAGDHWDEPNATAPDYPGCNGACPGTSADLQTLLLPHVDDDWQAPAS